MIKKYGVVIVTVFMMTVFAPLFNITVEADEAVISKTIKDSIESYDARNNASESVFTSNGKPCISFNNKDYQIFEIRFEESGYYDIDIVCGSKLSTYTPITSVFVLDDGEYVEIANAEINPTSTDSYDIFEEQTIGSYAFMEGTYIIKIYQTYGDIFLNSVNFQKISEGQDVSNSTESFNKATGNPDTVVNTASVPYVSFNGGDYQIFDLAVAESGLYKFELCLGAKDIDYRAITTISIFNGSDYIEAGSRIVESTGGYTNFEKQTVGYYELASGINRIKVYEKYADICLNGLVITKATEENKKITVNASDFVKSIAILSDDGTIKFNYSDWAEYSVDIETEGQYMFFVTGSNVSNTNTISLFLNDEELCLEKPAKGFNGAYTEYYVGNINLSKGTHNLKIKHTGTMYTNFSISSFSLLRIYDEKFFNITSNTSLVRNDAYDMSTKDDVFYEGDYLSYDIGFSESGIYKITIDAGMQNGIIGIGLNGENVGTISNFENDVIFASIEAENKLLRMQMLSGCAEIKSISFDKLSVVEQDIDSLLSEVNNATTAYEMSDVVEKWKPKFFSDFDEKTSDFLSFIPVYTKLCRKSYDDINEFVGELNCVISEEKIKPSVSLLNDGLVVRDIQDGLLSVNVKTDYIGNNAEIFAAVYENDCLYKVGTGRYTGKEKEIGIQLGEIKTKPDKIYTFKLILVENYNTLKPTEDFDNIYKEFYVSTNGSDENPGTEGHPFKTLQYALDVVSAQTSDMTGDIIINVAEGNHFITESVNITTAHSGQNGYNVIIKGTGDNKSVINGGKEIKNWDLYKNGIYRALYEPQKDVRNLYVNGFPAIRAKSEHAFRCVDFYSEYGVKNTGINVRDKYFPKIFFKPEDLELVWELVWKAQRTPVTNISYDGDLATIFINENLFERNSPNSTTGFGPEKMFYLENDLELLDQPGEFYYDSETGYIYYYPVEGEILDNCEIYVGVSQGLVNIEGSSLLDKVSNIVFENISFKYGKWETVSEYGMLGRQADEVLDLSQEDGYYCIPSQFIVNYADNISVRNCEFSSLGSTALAMRNGVSNSEIIGNKVIDVSGTGIAIGSPEHENDLELSCENIQIKNNLIRRAAIEYRGCTGISFYYDTALEICHNTLLELPYTAITGGWGWGATETGRAGSNRICHNRIENVMNTLADGGGVYLLGAQRNTVVTENYIDGVKRQNASLYSDNGSAFLRFNKNVCLNSERFVTASPGGHTNYYNDNYTDTNYFYHEYDSDISDYLIIKNNVVVNQLNLPDEAETIKDNSGLECNYNNLLVNTQIPYGKYSIIDITPKRTYISGTIYEGENFKTIADSGVVVYPNCLSIYNPYWAEYEIEIEKAGIYNFGVYSSVNYEDATEIEVFVNGEKQNGGTLLFTGSWSAYTYNEIGTINLPSGKVTLRIKSKTKGFQLDCFTLKYSEEV